MSHSTDETMPPRNPLASLLCLMCALSAWVSCAASAEEIPLVKQGGVYTVPVRLNDVITLDFIIDSGASEVQIPADVAMTLIRAGTIAEPDFLPGQTYTLADGSSVKSGRFMLKTLKVGSYSVNAVAATISNIEGPLLLGQSFLSKIPTWSQDNRRGMLILEEETSDAPPAEIPSPPATEGTPVQGSTRTGQKKGWFSDWGSEILAIATLDECRIGEFADQGYQYFILATIPVSRLNKRAEAYGFMRDRAITVQGCWSPTDGQMAKSKLRRKKDGKTWDQPLRFDDGSWQQIP